MKPSKIVLLTIGLLLLIAWARFQVMEYKRKDIVYTGTIIEKLTTGRSSTFLFVVNWDGIGIQTINAGPTNYALYNKGDRFQEQMQYVPILGRAGAAYVPSDPKTQASIFEVALMGALSIILVLMGIYWTGSFFYKLLKAMDEGSFRKHDWDNTYDRNKLADRKYGQNRTYEIDDSIP